MESLHSFTKVITAWRKVALAMPAIFLLSTACTQYLDVTAKNSQVPKYSTDALAKDWREQVRKNPSNPYEANGYPVDNDYDYYYPTKNPSKSGKNANKPTSSSPYSRYPNVPADNEDSNYGKFPRYNPDDDNLYLDSKTYPLYLD